MRPRARRRGGGRAPARPPVAARRSGVSIPFDYAATFSLTGRPGTSLESAISTSVDSRFVATAIGYGFESSRRVEPIEVRPSDPGQPNRNFFPWEVRLERIPVRALLGGLRLNPGDEPVLVDPEAGTLLEELPVAASYLRSMLQTFRRPPEPQFLLSMVDSATGRELQDQPVHHLAGLGKSTGERPFRPLARPLAFGPRSTVRLQVVELSEGAVGTLFIVLYGFKLFDLGAVPEAWRRAHARIRHGRGPRLPAGASDTVPYDYVAGLELEGVPGRRVAEEVPIDAGAAFVATAVGYGLQASQDAVALRTGEDPAPDSQGRVPLGRVRLSAFPLDALREGVRLRPDVVRLALRDDGLLSSRYDASLLDQTFERVGRPEDVSFRYAFHDLGTGQPLQDRMLHNVAGLGIADGDRPFKTFARPLVLLPRSTLRVEVEERFGRGRLFVAFQGFRLMSRTLAVAG